MRIAVTGGSGFIGTRLRALLEQAGHSCVNIDLKDKAPVDVLDLAALTAHLAERGVSKEWWPERLWVLPELPRSSGGKVAKSELKELVKTLAG